MNMLLHPPTVRRPCQAFRNNRKEPGNDAAASEIPSISDMDSHLSRSLGEFGTHFRPLRQHSDAKLSNYRGYLMKRSLNPVVSPDSDELRLPTFASAKPNSDDMTGESSTIDSCNSAPEGSFIAETLSKDRKPEIPLVIQERFSSVASLFGLDGEKRLRGEGVFKPSCSIGGKTEIAIISTGKVAGEVGSSGSSSRDLSDFEQHRNTKYPSAYHRCVSAPSGDDTLWSSRSESVDPKDGHIWRSKYCVLEDGVLYFYRNAADADLPEAQTERSGTAVVHSPASNDSRESKPNDFCLSMSPMPRAGRVPLSQVASSIARSKASADGSSADSDGCVVWEKMVPLDSVGAVRSTEDDYGPCSFALLTENEDSLLGSENCLVLRSSTIEEVNEWLFQFHRSLATVMKSLVDSVGSSRRDAKLYHHPTVGALLPPKSPRYFRGVDSFGAGDDSAVYYTKSMSPGQAGNALSHGHGRNGRHRRRANSHHKHQKYCSDSDCFSPSPVPRQTVGIESLFRRDGRSFDLERAVRNIGLVDLNVSNSFDGGNHSCDGTNGDAREPPIFLSTRPLQSSLPFLGSLGMAHADKLPETSGDCLTGSKAPSSRKYIPPHMREKNLADDDSRVSTSQKYIPPHMRNSVQQPTEVTPKAFPSVDGDNGMFDFSMDESPAVASPLSDIAALSRMYGTERMGTECSTDGEFFYAKSVESAEMKSVNSCADGVFLKLGGCAERETVLKSIGELHDVGLSLNARGKYRAFGGHGGECVLSDGEGGKGFGILQWEVGAVSERGIRDSNEDSYLIASDLSALCGNQRTGGHEARMGVFGVFDGHCGNEAATFAAEKLASYLDDCLKLKDCSYGNEPKLQSESDDLTKIEECLIEAIIDMDDEFCRLCTEEGKDWISGSTALVALIVDDNMLVSNLGDCRGVVCCSSNEGCNERGRQVFSYNEGWNTLVDDGNQGWVINGNESKCYWKELSDSHSPARDDERQRIEVANGWVTVEQEICVAQLQRLDWCDDDVVEILQRCFADRLDAEEASRNNVTKNQRNAAPGRLLQISRICGELSVSRAIGDKDFKEKFNSPVDIDRHGCWWGGPDFLPYPSDHISAFQGDLVSAVPEVKIHKIGREGVFQEFLLLACDGLWDVMDVEEAVRVARGLLFEKRWEAKKAAARLAEIAIHLGSSDNVTVMLLRFFRGLPEDHFGAIN